MQNKPLMVVQKLFTMLPRRLKITVPIILKFTKTWLLCTLKWWHFNWLLVRVFFRDDLSRFLIVGKVNRCAQLAKSWVLTAVCGCVCRRKINNKYARDWSAWSRSSAPPCVVCYLLFQNMFIVWAARRTTRYGQRSLLASISVYVFSTSLGSRMNSMFDLNWI